MLPLILSTLLASPQTGPDSKPTAAAQLYAPCAGCHGAKGEGNPAIGGPALAGQPMTYLLRQLQRYRDGSFAKGPGAATAQMMTASVKPLQDADLQTLARDLAGRPAGPIQRAKPSAKQELYLQKCGTCHGRDRQGNQAMSAPALVGLPKAFLTHQMARYRAAGILDKDPAGASMAAIARALSEAEVAALVTLLAAP